MSYKCDCPCPHEADGKKHAMRECYDQSCPRCMRCTIHMPWRGDCASCEPFDGAARKVNDFEVQQQRDRQAFIDQLVKSGERNG